MSLSIFLTFSLPNIHTCSHTHTQPRLPPCPQKARYFRKNSSLSRSLSVTHTHTHTHARTATPPPISSKRALLHRIHLHRSHTHTHTCVHTYSHIFFRFIERCNASHTFISLSFSLSHTRVHTATTSPVSSTAHFFPQIHLSIFSSLSLSLPHTHTHTHTHSHDCSRVVEKHLVLHKFISLYLSLSLFHTHTHTATTSPVSSQSALPRTHSRSLLQSLDPPGQYILKEGEKGGGVEGGHVAGEGVGIHPRMVLNHHLESVKVFCSPDGNSMVFVCVLHVRMSEVACE